MASCIHHGCDGGGGRCLKCREIHEHDATHGTSHVLDPRWIGGPGETHRTLFRHTDAGRVFRQLLTHAKVFDADRKFMWSLYDKATQNVLKRTHEKATNAFVLECKQRSKNRLTREHPGAPTGNGSYRLLNPSATPSATATKLRRNLAASCVLRERGEIVHGVGEREGSMCTGYTRTSSGLHIITISNAILRPAPGIVSAVGVSSKLVIVLRTNFNDDDN